MVFFWLGTDQLVMRLADLRRSLTGSSRTHGEQIGERKGTTKSAVGTTYVGWILWFLQWFLLILEILDGNQQCVYMYYDGDYVNC